jgi:hypothetical protein
VFVLFARYEGDPTHATHKSAVTVFLLLFFAATLSFAGDVLVMSSVLV